MTTTIVDPTGLFPSVRYPYLHPVHRPDRRHRIAIHRRTIDKILIGIRGRRRPGVPRRRLAALCGATKFASDYVGDELLVPDISFPAAAAPRGPRSERSREVRRSVGETRARRRRPTPVSSMVTSRESLMAPTYADLGTPEREAGCSPSGRTVDAGESPGHDRPAPSRRRCGDGTTRFAVPGGDPPGAPVVGLRLVDRRDDRRASPRRSLPRRRRDDGAGRARNRAPSGGHPATSLTAQSPHSSGPSGPRSSQTSTRAHTSSLIGPWNTSWPDEDQGQPSANDICSMVCSPWLRPRPALGAPHDHRDRGGRRSTPAYGALGVLDEAGHRLTDFITVGIDELSREAMGNLPRGTASSGC